MLLSLLQRYSLKISFAVMLFIGLQLPHFLAQYETRLDAHYIESKQQLSHYQKLADLLFAGDLHALVEKHKNSEITLFKAETSIIKSLISRSEFLEKQKQQLQGPLYKKFAFLMTQMNHPLFTETQKNYQANIVINQQAIFVGVIIAVTVTLLVEMLFLFFPLLVRKIALKRRVKPIN